MVQHLRERSFSRCCPQLKITTSGKADEIRELLQSERRLTISDIGLKVGLSTSTVHSIVTRDHSMSKVCTRWIPQILTLEQKHQRVRDTKSFLRQYRNHAIILVMWARHQKQTFVSPPHGGPTCNLVSIGPAVSEETFENVDNANANSEANTDDGPLPIL